MVDQLTTADPTTLGAYTLHARLGAGGQGVVYLGSDENGRQVAVKTLRTDVPLDPDALELLAREARAASRVAPFCTAQVLDVVLDHDPAYVVTEYVPGPTLGRYVRERGPLDERALDRLAVATLTALKAIHRAHLVHRDVKPANVILGPDGPRLIDFGIARDLRREPSTVTASSWGTPEYSPPERIRGLPAEPAGDVFSWACTMVHAATGRSPFTGPEPAAVIHRVLTAEPDLTAVPDRLRGLLADCLAKDPAARPSAAAAEDLLTAPRPDGEEPAPPGTPAGPDRAPDAAAPDATSPTLTVRAAPPPPAPVLPATEAVPTEVVPTAAGPTEVVPTATPTERAPVLPPTEAVPAAGPTDRAPVLPPTEAVPSAIPTDRAPVPRTAGAVPTAASDDLLFEPASATGDVGTAPETAPETGSETGSVQAAPPPPSPPPAGPAERGPEARRPRPSSRRRLAVAGVGLVALLAAGSLIDRSDRPDRPTSGSRQDDGTNDSSLEQDWKGRLTWPGGSSWEVELSIDDHGDDGDFSFPDHDCEGSLAITSVTSTSLTATASADDPSSSCPASAAVDLARDAAGTVTLTWRDPATGETAGGTLEED